MLVVGRDADVRALGDERLEAADVVRAHLVVVLEGDLLGLDVDALAESDVVEARHVALGSPQTGLQDDTDVLATVGAHRPEELESAVGGRRILHVDPHEVPARGCVDDDSLEVLAAELEVELETKPRELHRHVGVEALLVDPREGVVVLPGDRPRLVRARDLLAEHVDGRELALRVQPAHHPDGIVERRARDVPRRKPLDDGLGDRRQEPDDRAIEKGHGRPDGIPIRSVASSVSEGMKLTRPLIVAAALAAALAGAALAGVVTHKGADVKTIKVTEKEFHITLSTRTGAVGPVRFVIKNTGKYTHGLAISGPGREAQEERAHQARQDRRSSRSRSSPGPTHSGARCPAMPRKA